MTALALLDVFVPPQFIDHEAAYWPSTDITSPQPPANAVQIPWAVQVVSATAVHLEASWTSEPPLTTSDGSEIAPAVVVDVSDIDLAAGTLTLNAGTAELVGTILSGTWTMPVPTIPVDPAVVRLQLTWTGGTAGEPQGASFAASMPTVFQGGS